MPMKQYFLLSSCLAPLSVHCGTVLQFFFNLSSLEILECLLIYSKQG